jgi:pimeloyl-ACP methyl ester carboxylesterase
MSSDVEGRLGEVEAPVLVVQGGCDEVVPEGHADWLVEQLPNARKLLIPGAGHSPFIEQAELFAEEVGGFLTGSTS